MIRIASEAMRPSLSAVLDEVLEARQRHVSQGYDDAHDDVLTAGELIDEAFLHIGNAGAQPSDAALRRALVVAMGLLLAEIERLDRKAFRSCAGSAPSASAGRHPAP